MDKFSLDTDRTKVSEVMHANTGFSVQQGENMFVLNSEKEWNIFLGNLGMNETIQHTFQILNDTGKLLQLSFPQLKRDSRE